MCRAAEENVVDRQTDASRIVELPMLDGMHRCKIDLRSSRWSFLEHSNTFARLLRPPVSDAARSMVRDGTVPIDTCRWKEHKLVEAFEVSKTVRVAFAVAETVQRDAPSQVRYQLLEIEEAMLESCRLRLIGLVLDFGENGVDLLLKDRRNKNFHVLDVSGDDAEYLVNDDMCMALDQKEHSHALELESGTEPGTDRPHGLVLVLLASVVQLKPKLTGHEAIMTVHLI